MSLGLSRIARREVEHLAKVVESTQKLTIEHPPRTEDNGLVLPVTESLEICQQTMETIRSKLVRFCKPGQGRRNLVVMFRWIIRNIEGEIRDMRLELTDHRAMIAESVQPLRFTLARPRTAANSGTVVQEWRADRSTDRGSRKGTHIPHRRLKDGIESVSDSSERRFKLERFLDNTTSLAAPTAIDDEDYVPLRNVNDTSILVERTEDSVLLLLEEVSPLLQSGCDLRDSAGDLLAAVTIGEGLADFKAFLAAPRQRLNVVPAVGPLLVHEAIEHNNKALGILLDAGFNPNILEESGLSPIYPAILVRSKPAALLLCQHGADTHRFFPEEAFANLRPKAHWHEKMIGEGEGGAAPLQTAAHRTQDPGIGARPPGRGTRGSQPASVCAWMFMETAKLLIDFGADVNHQQGTPLHWAIRCHNGELLEYMLARGRPKLDDTTRRLVELDVRLDVRDQDDRRPIDLMDATWASSSVRKLLEEKVREQGLLE
ncbi:hypothetical protein B0H66DRAFT_621466 [Apodospora peruviana]|uniref:Ankyrin n=1 Tax=Apodospora peruviana TaxID=516989 RepID=A0AAE0I5J3_9PEZI|nr:hypothetical protein B0H66DRAFT_621466 [Apodospora peruviana]